jgi:chaperone required for assembly of F1-ATPase
MTRACGVLWVAAGAAILGAACATGGGASGRPARSEAAPPRVSDSRPEKLAAQRAAAPASLELESNDERWGIEAARDRRELEQQKKAATPVATPSPPSLVPAAGTP